MLFDEYDNWVGCRGFMYLLTRLFVRNIINKRAVVDYYENEGTILLRISSSRERIYKKKGKQ